MVSSPSLCNWLLQYRPDLSSACCLYSLRIFQQRCTFPRSDFSVFGLVWPAQPNSITTVLSSVTVLFYSDLRMLLVIVPLLIIYTLMIIYYQRSNREFKRHSSTLNSSLHAHISETLSGAPTLKAYQIENVSIQKGRRLLESADSCISQL